MTWKLSRRTRGAAGKARRRRSHLERLFVDVNVISSFDLFGLAEEDEVFKQEDVAEVLPPPAPDDELILAAELTLLFQVHLQRKHKRPPCVTENNAIPGGIPISHRQLHNNDLRIRNSFNGHFPRPSTNHSRAGLCLITAYITSTNRVHSQQVIAVAKLKFDHVLCCAEVTQLLLLRLAALLDQVFEQQSVFAHPLDGL